MFKLLAVVALSAGVAAAPAAATVVTYDAFTSFNATQGAGGFTYGTYDGVGFTPFTMPSGCTGLISDTICLNNGFLPAAFKSTTGAHQSGSVMVPGDALILHPGPDAGEASALVFTTPHAGAYTFNFSAFVADNNPSGVNLDLFIPGFLSGSQLATLTAANPTYSTVVSGYLPVGFQVGFAVDYDGVYYNDSTGINLTVAGPVPEPASWVLLIAGFGLVGVAARNRRRNVAVAA